MTFYGVWDEGDGGLNPLRDPKTEIKNGDVGMKFCFSCTLAPTKITAQNCPVQWKYLSSDYPAYF